jgi:putative PIN family toxin of toxin-antitoxin system
MRRMDRSPLFQRWMAGDFVWVTSVALLSEFKQVTNRSGLARRIRRLARDALIDKLLADAVIVTPATDFPHCRDPKDDIVIATAVAARADFIVTADDDLHDPALAVHLQDEWKIRVAFMGEFLDALTARSPG